ncbi:hypothetical protein PhCBS80983_g00759 [Powellomyces hirtus]|uniref:Kynurenine formamidase n=1 Tax=Powellomyces hirtus TaxID=109895 RepID=A0A507EF48_9FUNG|nr:hypothetical protein PhCBS80983_g00759 [Powellomyces hirtus]
MPLRLYQAETVKTYKSVPYIPDADDTQRTLDLYMPVFDTDLPPRATEEPRPVIVYIHGGAWRTGDKSEYEFLGEQFASSAGVPTAVIGYRLSRRGAPDSPHHPDHLLDCANAVAWLRSDEGIAHLGFVANDIYLVGHSAGALMSGLLALQPHWLENLGGRGLWDAVRGVVGVEGIYDVPSLVAEWPSYQDFIELAFTSDQAVWKAGSPQMHSLLAEYFLPDYLVIHSTEDELINTGHAQRYVDHLERQGGKHVDFDTSVKGRHFEMLREKRFFDVVIKFIEKSQSSR